MNSDVKRTLETVKYSLAAPQDNGKFDDLQFLGETLKGIRLFGMGEATHGTKEFYQYKHRIFRFLAEYCGFRTLFLESAQDEVDLINEYVLYGKGEGAGALAGLHFRAYDTEEILAFIEWAREHNRTCLPGEEVSVIGFDVLFCDVAKKRLAAKLLPVAGAAAEKISNVLETPDKEGAAWLCGWLEVEKTELLKALCPEDYREICRYARHIYHWTDVNEIPSERLGRREKWMAENIRAALSEKPDGSRAAVWSHNVHVSCSPLKGKSMGGWLAEWFGAAYYPMAMSYIDGNFQSRELVSMSPLVTNGIREFNNPKTTDKEWAGEINALGKGNFFVDIRKACADPAVVGWANQIKNFRVIGTAFPPDGDPKFYNCPWNMRESFSAVLQVQFTHMSVPTKTGADWK